MTKVALTLSYIPMSNIAQYLVKTCQITKLSILRTVQDEVRPSLKWIGKENARRLLMDLYWHVLYT